MKDYCLLNVVASKLTNLPYPLQIDKDLIEYCRKNGIVICYCTSDDLMEFDGAFYASFDCYGGEIICINEKGRKANTQDYYSITAIWHGGWQYDFKPEHRIFKIIDTDCDEIYCIGIVFFAEDLKKTQKTSLYNLTTEYTDLYNKLLDSVDEETGELDMTISQALEAKGKEFTEKAVAVATVYRKFDNEITLYDNEIKRLKAIKERLERCRDRVKENLSTACERTGTTEIKGLYANVSFRASETVEIDNIESIPKQYLTKKVTVTADKTAIKQALKRGETIDGVHIEKHNNIQIK